MTAPDQQPEFSIPSDVAIPEGLQREIERIEIDDLDKENKGWVKTYLEQMKTRLADEQAAPQPDFVMISYIKREIETYQDLFDRNDKK